jgi:hypothetical protein
MVGRFAFGESRRRQMERVCSPQKLLGKLLNADIESHAVPAAGWQRRESAKNERIKMLLPKSLNHFINAVNSPLQKFPKTPLRLCDLA